MILTVKQKFQRENSKKKAGKCLNSKFSGESFLGGSSFNLGGAMFQRVVTWGGGCLDLSKVEKRPYLIQKTKIHL